MKKDIQEHYRKEDLQILKLNSDIENWKAEIEFMTKEITFHTSLLTALLTEEKDDKTVQNTQKLLRELKQMEQQNNTLAESLLNFENDSEGINECDDLQCETYFLNNHEDFRAFTEKHVLQFRVLKEVIFSHLDGNK